MNRISKAFSRISGSKLISGQGMFLSQNLGFQTINLDVLEAPIKENLIRIYNVGIKLWVKTYRVIHLTSNNGFKKIIWRKFWLFKPFSNYLNTSSKILMVVHPPCRAVNFKNYGMISSQKIQELSHLQVMASTTIYTIEHVKEEKSFQSGPTRRKSSLKKSNCKCKRKNRHVTVSEPEPPSKEAELTEEEIQKLEEVLKEIDAKLEKHIDLETCLRTLMKLAKKYPDEPKILWRIGKAYQKFAEKEVDVETKLNHVEKGIESCRKALDIVYEQADAHKWMAILVGYKGQFQSTKGKIYCGKLFKKHLDIAIFLNPSDPVLQHMAGRFCLELASLSWVERKIAKQVFSDPIECSIDIAIDHFLQAEKFMGQGQWKENKLLIAKCYIMKEDYEQALEWLDDAKHAKDDSGGEIVQKEIEELLQKYSKYR